MRFRIGFILTVAIAATAGCKATFGDVDTGVAPADASADAAELDAASADATVVDPADCPPSQTQVQDPVTGHCYTRFVDPLNWNQAQEACAALGPTVHLAVSNSEDENDLFTPLAGLNDVWIGGTDFLDEGTFLWITLEPMEFVNFRANEPNNGGVNGEDCMVLEGDNGGVWDDRGCGVALTYVCERE